jgi:hypothetical protein
MKKMLISAVALCTLGLVGCGEDATIDDTKKDPPIEAKKFDTSAKILAHLEGKTMVMEGANIPSHPNGYSEDVNLGSATQCYSKVAISVAGGIFNVSSDLATVSNNNCDHVKAKELKAATTNVLIENVQGDGECFDVLFTYTGYQQEGRGKVSGDGKTVTLELFFKDQAVGIRCANGAVGSGNITLNKAAFTGNAQQVYVIQ